MLQLDWLFCSKSFTNSLISLSLSAAISLAHCSSHSSSAWLTAKQLDGEAIVLCWFHSVQTVHRVFSSDRTVGRWASRSHSFCFSSFSDRLRLRKFAFFNPLKLFDLFFFCLLSIASLVLSIRSCCFNLLWPHHHHHRRRCCRVETEGRYCLRASRCCINSERENT